MCVSEVHLLPSLSLYLSYSEPITNWHETWSTTYTWKSKYGGLEKTGDDIIWGNYDVIVIFQGCGQIGAIWDLIPGTWSIILTYFCINNNFNLTKAEKQI